MSAFELSAFPPEEAPGAASVCAVSGRPFQSGDKIWSLLYREDGAIKRVDLCAEAWRNYKRPESAVAWWSFRVAQPNEKKAKLTPNDALVALFESLVLRSDQADLRYALALLLARRRVFHFEFDSVTQHDGGAAPRQDVVFVYSSRSDACYAIPVVPMDEAKIADVQNRLVALLDAPEDALDAADVERAAAAAADAMNEE